MPFAAAMWTALSLAALALALAADAFAVSLAQGGASRATLAHALLLGGAFGAAQGLMPLLGWMLGAAFVGMVAGVDHWVALVLLAAIGARMLHQAAQAGAAGADPLAGWALAAAALATSVDAFAAGLTLPAFAVPVLAACAAIGAVTFLLCAAGVLIGRAAGLRLGRRAEAAGGILLIGLGLKIFVEHQFLGG